MDDYLVRIWAKDAGVRAIACVTTNLVNEGNRRHQARATAAAALGRALTGASLMGALLKVQQRVAIKFEGNGPLQKMIVESNSYGVVRGYVQEPKVALPLLNDEPDVAAAIGMAGLLTVVRDLKLPDLARSVTVLTTSTVDGDLEAYLTQSEQVASAVQVGLQLADGADEAYTQTAVAGGLLVQAMPPLGDEMVQMLRERMQELPPVAALLMQGLTPEDLLAKLFVGLEYEELEKRPLRFQCSCSRERSENALVSLGRAEVEALLAEGEAIVDCHFCHERYRFDREDLAQLLAEMSE